MSGQIVGRSRELLEGTNLCGVVTIGKDGRPDVVVVWVDTDGEGVLLNSAEGRAWPESLRRDPRVTLAVANHENPYEYVAIDGEAVEITTEGADEHPWMLERLEASRLAVLAPDVHDDDPVPLRERYYRQHLDASRWLRVVVDFGSEPAWVVTVTVQDSDPRE